jgi:hypothetical protein
MEFKFNTFPKLKTRRLYLKEARLPYYELEKASNCTQTCKDVFNPKESIQVLKKIVFLNSIKMLCIFFKTNKEVQFNSHS